MRNQLSPSCTLAYQNENFEVAIGNKHGVIDHLTMSCTHLRGDMLEGFSIYKLEFGLGTQLYEESMRHPITSVKDCLLVSISIHYS